MIHLSQASVSPRISSILIKWFNWSKSSIYHFNSLHFSKEILLSNVITVLKAFKHFYAEENCRSLEEVFFPFSTQQKKDDKEHGGEPQQTKQTSDRPTPLSNQLNKTIPCSFTLLFCPELVMPYPNSHLTISKDDW